MLRRFFILVFILTGSIHASAQDTNDPVLDSAAVADTLDVDEYYNEVSERVYRGEADSSEVEARAFDAEALDRLKRDPSLDYKEPPTIAESLWDRLLLWIRNILRDLYDGAVQTPWGRLITYAIVLALLVVLIMMVLRVNAFRVLYSGDGAKLPYNVLDENIHEMNFEKLIQEAIDQQDYRRGIRLIFLSALKVLADKQLINWQAGKTNHDYVSEVQQREVKTGLNELSFFFDYAWYGNFNVTADTFNRAKSVFTNWRSNIR